MKPGKLARDHSYSDLRAGYRSAIDLLGRHLPKREKARLLREMTSKSERSPMIRRSFFSPVSKKIGISSRSDNPATGAHEATHFLEDQKIDRYRPTGLWPRQLIEAARKQEHLSTAIQVLTAFHDARQFARLGENEVEKRQRRIIDTATQTMQQLRAKRALLGEMSLRRSYARGYELGLKAIELSQEVHPQAGKWFLFLLSRGKSEQQAEQMARTIYAPGITAGSKPVGKKPNKAKTQ